MSSLVNRIGHGIGNVLRGRTSERTPPSYKELDNRSIASQSTEAQGPSTAHAYRSPANVPVLRELTSLESVSASPEQLGYWNAALDSRRFCYYAPNGSPAASPHAVGPSYFANSHGFSIQNQHITTNQFTSPKTLFELLSSHIAHGAAHDSNERCNAPACHEETRVAIRDEIVSWINDGDEDEEPTRIMWLSGPAGSGKTAIAGSIAEACKEGGLLAASFFFSSFSPSAERSSKRGLVATLAFQISRHRDLHQFKVSLLTSLEQHPDILYKNLREQAECLILGPLRTTSGIGGSLAGWPKVVIVDGLDEVVAKEREEVIQRESEDDQVEILNVLLALAQSPYFPFRVFVASRPERNIADFFASDASTFTSDLFLDSKYNPDADIERFLKSKFTQIRRRSGISDGSWPGEPVIKRIVDMASGQFIVPATIIRWVEAGVPQTQLEEILQVQRQTLVHKNPFATLDALYRHIIKRAHNPDNDPDQIVKWILSITSAIGEGPNRSRPSAQFWTQFLEDVEGELNYRMGPVVSLIYVPPPDKAHTPILIYHKSLTDFLSSESRCGDLFVNKTTLNTFIAGRIAKVLRHSGPIVPRPLSSTDLRDFLHIFLDLQLVTGGSVSARKPACTNFASFLEFLTDESKVELATSDVEWWAGAFPPLLPLSAKPKCLIRGIYFGIHKGIKCGRRVTTLSPTTQQSKCHPACFLWRAGIRDKAEELNLSATLLEGVPLEDLEDVTVLGLGKFNLR